MPLRLGKSTTTRFLYDGTDFVAEYDVAGILLQRYVHGSYGTSYSEEVP